MERIFVFQSVERCKDGRPYVIAIPESKITTVRSVMGSEHVYLVVNGMEVEGSFQDFTQVFGDRVNVKAFGEK